MSLISMMCPWIRVAAAVAPLAWLLPVAVPVQGQLPPGQGILICNAGDARANTPAPPFLVGVYDRVPVTPAGNVGFFVAYSARSEQAGPTGPITNNVSMFLFKLVNGPTGRSEVLVFGTGYGDHPVATNGATYDAVTVDKCIRRCMNLVASETDLRFVVPHGHVDHINPEFVAAMRVLGYGVRDITFHTGDQGLVNNMNGWTAQDQAAFRVLTQPGTCTPLTQVNEGAGEFDTTLGPLWFFRRPGHTPGSIDAVLDSDVDGYTARIVIRGSAPPPGPNAPCAIYPPTDGFDGTFVVLAHGNVIAEQLQ